MSDDPVSRSLGIPLFWLFFWALPLSTGPALASGVATSLMLESPISSGVYPITLPASRLPQLRGIPWAQLTLYRMDDSVPVLIPFQIDRRDVRGRLLTEPFHEITDQDEFVFMARDIGQNLPEPASIPNLETIARITVTSSSEDGYLFIARSTKGVAPRAQQDYVHYDTATDCVRSKAYEICFAAQQPFLMNSVRWRSP